jgi:hypothetical protein
MLKFDFFVKAYCILDPEPDPDQLELIGWIRIFNTGLYINSNTLLSKASPVNGLEVLLAFHVSCRQLKRRKH